MDADDFDYGQTIRTFSSGQRLFQRFTLKQVLGRGGKGMVWQAYDEQLDHEVALKFLPDVLVHDTALLNELKYETLRSLKLTHHNIVRIYDFVRDKQCAGISMEYVDGPTLSALHADRSSKIFVAEEVAPLVWQLCEALTYAHECAQIVHRDLKPANLMLSSRGELKVADFGIARSVSDSVTMLTGARGGTGGSSGTLVYMSPQQLDGERATILDDIYSTGATIYELLTSKPPFYSGNIDGQVHNKVAPSMSQRRADLNVRGTAEIPREWEDTIAACLAKNPAQRPQSMRELVEWLSNGVPSERATVEPQPSSEPETVSQVAEPEACESIQRESGAVQPVRLTGTRKSRLAGVVAAILLAFGVVAGWWFGIEQPSRKYVAQVAKVQAERVKADADAASVQEEKRKADEIQRAQEARLAEEKRQEEAEKNAEAANAESHYRLGWKYEYGKDVEKDLNKAAELYKKAADQGNADAQYNLGILYMTGEGVEKDLGKAAELYKKAAD